MPQMLRLHSRPSAPAETALPATTRQPVDSIGEQLAAHFGKEYSIAWLAGRLECPLETAAEVAGYWLPLEPAHLRQQALMVFANALRLSMGNLRALLEEVAPIRSRWAGPAPTLVRRRQVP